MSTTHAKASNNKTATANRALAREVHVDLREEFGVPRALPMNDTAKAIAQIAGTKTLTPETLVVCKKLGYEVIPGSYQDLPAFLRKHL